MSTPFSTDNSDNSENDDYTNYSDDDTEMYEAVKTAVKPKDKKTSNIKQTRNVKTLLENTDQLIQKLKTYNNEKTEYIKQNSQILLATHKQKKNTNLLIYSKQDVLDASLKLKSNRTQKDNDILNQEFVKQLSIYAPLIQNIKQYNYPKQKQPSNNVVNINDQKIWHTLAAIVKSNLQNKTGVIRLVSQSALTYGISLYLIPLAPTAVVGILKSFGPIGIGEFFLKKIIGANAVNLIASWALIDFFESVVDKKATYFLMKPISNQIAGLLGVITGFDNKNVQLVVASIPYVSKYFPLENVLSATGLDLSNKLTGAITGYISEITIINKLMSSLCNNFITNAAHTVAINSGLITVKDAIMIEKAKIDFYQLKYEKSIVGRCIHVVDTVLATLLPSFITVYGENKGVTENMATTFLNALKSKKSMSKTKKMLGESAQYLVPTFINAINKLTGGDMKTVFKMATLKVLSAFKQLGLKAVPTGIVTYCTTNYIFTNIAWGLYKPFIILMMIGNTEIGKTVADSLSNGLFTTIEKNVAVDIITKACDGGVNLYYSKTKIEYEEIQFEIKQELQQLHQKIYQDDKDETKIKQMENKVENLKQQKEELSKQLYGFTDVFGRLNQFEAITGNKQIIVHSGKETKDAIVSNFNKHVNNYIPPYETSEYIANVADYNNDEYIHEKITKLENVLKSTVENLSVYDEKEENEIKNALNTEKEKLTNNLQKIEQTRKEFATKYGHKFNVNNLFVPKTTFDKPKMVKTSEEKSLLPDNLQQSGYVENTAESELRYALKNELEEKVKQERIIEQLNLKLEIFTNARETHYTKKLNKFIEILQKKGDKSVVPNDRYEIIKMMTDKTGDYKLRYSELTAGIRMQDYIDQVVTSVTYFLDNSLFQYTAAGATLLLTQSPKIAMETKEILKGTVTTLKDTKATLSNIKKAINYIATVPVLKDYAVIQKTAEHINMSSGGFGAAGNPIPELFVNFFDENFDSTGYLKKFADLFKVDELVETARRDLHDVDSKNKGDYKSKFALGLSYFGSMDHRYALVNYYKNLINNFKTATGLKVENSKDTIFYDFKYDKKQLLLDIYNDKLSKEQIQTKIQYGDPERGHADKQFISWAFYL